jgi:hypothetical protein
MSALIRKEVPLGFASRDIYFIESDQFECEKGKIPWILMVSSLKGFGSGIPIPLLAGDLASPAGRTLRCIYEKGFICH